MRIPSLRIGLILDVSANGRRSTTRRILSARDSPRIIFPFRSFSLVSRLPEIANWAGSTMTSISLVAKAPHLRPDDTLAIRLCHIHGNRT